MDWVRKDQRPTLVTAFETFGKRSKVWIRQSFARIRARSLDSSIVLYCLTVHCTYQCASILGSIEIVEIRVFGFVDVVLSFGRGSMNDSSFALSLFPSLHFSRSTKWLLFHLTFSHQNCSLSKALCESPFLSHKSSSTFYSRVTPSFASTLSSLLEL